MNWIIFALISVASISVASVFQKTAMRDEKSDPVVSSIVFQFFVTALT
jgi:uncharacterized membrane protein